MDSDIEFKEKYDKAKGWKKFLLFNIYAILLALLFFFGYRSLSWVISLIDKDLPLDSIWADIKMAIVWSYIMAFLFLHTRLLTLSSNKKKKINKHNKI